ncbi:MAG TPA: hypothetical protein VFP21_02845, partial [Solirubrobacterales bacterium]|nr:hypothetical protein [Solirubrobacterales bacterium]
MPDQPQAGRRAEDASSAGRIALKVSAMHADLLSSLHEEIGSNEGGFADAAQQLAGEFGVITAAAVEATQGVGGHLGDVRRPNSGEGPANVTQVPANGSAVVAPERAEELPSLYRQGHMRRRLEQLLETNRRYGHPFGLAVFDASGPGTRPGDVAGGQETVLSIVGAALRDSIRIVDEAFRLEEQAIAVLAPNIGTVEGVQMCERLLGQLDELEKAGGLRICLSAGVVACPDHGTEAE